MPSQDDDKNSRSNRPDLDFLNNVAMQMALLSSKFTNWQETIVLEFDRIKQALKESESEVKELEKEFLERLKEDDKRREKLQEQIVEWRGQLKIITYTVGLMLGAMVALGVAWFSYILTQRK